MSHSRLIFIGFFIMLPQWAHAQAADELFDMSLEQLLNQPVVTASRYQQTVQEAPAIITVLSAEQIRNSGASSLYQLLEQVTSFYMSGSHFFPNNVSAVRGDLLTHADNHVLILLNGKPLRESYSGGINFAIYNAFPILALDRVEVIRGPGSVLYGSNAFSGVINLVTGSKNGSRAQLGLGQAGYGSAALALTTEQSAWRAQLAVQLNQQDGWRFGSFDNNGQYDEMDYGQKNSGIYASVTYNSWQLDALSLQSEQDFFGASTSWAGTVAPGQRQEKGQRHALTLSNQWQQSERFWLDSAISIARMEFSHYNYDAYATERYIELNQHWKASEVLALQAGGALWWQRFGTEAGLAAAPVPQTRNRRDTAFLQADWAVLPTVKLSLGTQFNHSQRGNSEWVPRAGIVWQLNPQWHVKLLQAQAYRDPYGVETDFSLILRNADGDITGGLRGNPALTAETVDTTDLQLLYQSSRQKWSLTLFDSQAKQLISRQRAADNVIDFVNRGTMQLTGAELEWTRQWPARWSFDSALTYQKNKVNAQDDFTTVPNWLFKSTLQYNAAEPYGVVNLQAQYVGKAADIAVRNPARQALNPAADAYWLVNLSWRLPLQAIWPQAPAGTSVQTVLYNLLDEAIYQPEFVGQRINTIPARSQRWFKLELNWDW
ncbi:TonB-dependent receptor plug domain-containing protein [Rheinheimera maricola]|uniref:TonB-dependent receptor n=1 Tax=Rheinheimera maricola TaxID=2793282 RepID=A0ABS7X8U8_9GAMM|nr:TonB-dependent receptor [Rheinheimera maricola]MBZ9611535.1 TonB-dependent receptor [Rheinheimera maricola]